MFNIVQERDSHEGKAAEGINHMETGIVGLGHRIKIKNKCMLPQRSELLDSPEALIRVSTNRKTKYLC